MKTEVAADQAKLALSIGNIGDFIQAEKLDQRNLIWKSLKNVCVQIKKNDTSVIDFLVTPSKP